MKEETEGEDKPKKPLYKLHKSYYLYVKNRRYGFKKGISYWAVWSPPIVERDEEGNVTRILSPRRSFAFDFPEGLDVRYVIRNEILKRYYESPRKA